MKLNEEIQAHMAEEIAALNEAVAEYERETPKEGSPAKR